MEAKGEGGVPCEWDYFWLRSLSCAHRHSRTHTHSLSHARAHTRTHMHTFLRSLSCALLCLFSNRYFCLRIFSSLFPACPTVLSWACRAHTAPLHRPSPPPGLPELGV